MFAQNLANFVSSLSYQSLPAEVVEKAKLCVLDFISVAVAGCETEWCMKVLHLMREIGGKPESTVLSYGDRIPSPNAALINGTMGHSWDFDDTHYSQLHPGTVIVPTALAIAEREGATGRDFLTAVTAGYEVMTRVTLAVNSPPKRGHTLRGFHPTATCGTFAAAATAGKILNLNSDRLVNALGIAGSFAAGLLEFLADGAMTKRLHPGKAAHDGILSALLAEKGFTGPRSVFEGRDGFLRAYSDDPKPEELIKDLGKRFEILSVEFKSYSSCRSTHASLDALLNIIKSHHLSPEEIEEISVEVSTLDWYIAGQPLELKRNPSTPLEAQMSIPFCIALLILEGKVVPSQFTPSNIRNEKLLALAKKVNVVAKQEFDLEQTKGAMPAVVTVKTKNRGKLSARVDYPKGSPKQPMSKKDVEEKFVQLASNIISPDSVMKVVDELEKLESITVLTDLLVSKRKG